MQTPYYRYDLNLLKQTLEQVSSCTAAHSNWHVHYAIKANANPLLLAPIRQAGLGVDCVSGGEIAKALENGFPASSIVFAGVGKADWEIDLALDKQIACFNVESSAELDVIIERCQAKGRTAHIALRVNPNVDAHTHASITTGMAENKFGIEMPMLEPIIDKVLASDRLVFEGLHFHIGSQITSMEPYRELCVKINAIQEQLSERGIRLNSINVGGGLGIDYQNPELSPIPDFQSYFKVFEQDLQLSAGQHLHFELGRSIVAQCGSLVTKVLYVKQGTVKQFAIVDAGMTDLIRPALYGAHHKIVNLTSALPQQTYDVVGPICESSDVFETAACLPKTRRGDLLAILSAGAYGESMASTYNCRAIPKSCLE